MAKAPVKTDKEPFDGKGDHDNDGKTGGAAAPQPTQTEADAALTAAAPDATTSEPAATPDAPDAIVEAVKVGKKSVNDARKEAGKTPVAAPFPTQDDLDAMRDGTYQNRELKSR